MWILIWPETRINNVQKGNLDQNKSDLDVQAIIGGLFRFGAIHVGGFQAAKILPNDISAIVLLKRSGTVRLKKLGTLTLFLSTETCLCLVGNILKGGLLHLWFLGHTTWGPSIEVCIWEKRVWYLSGSFSGLLRCLQKNLCDHLP